MTTADRTSDAPRTGRSTWWWSDLRPLLLRLHFYAGLLVGPFILVAATTGLLYTLTPQIDQLFYRDTLHVPVGTDRLPLAEQVTAAAAAVPDGAVTEIRPPFTADGTTRVTFDAPGVETDYSRTAFVDPYTGQVRAVHDTFGEWLPARAWIDELHRTLHLGNVGRVYSELAASWLWVLALSGLAIWIGRGLRRQRVRRTLLPERSATGRTRRRSWHGAVGLWAALGMLMLSVTGLTWSQFAGANVSTLRQSLSWTAPTVAEETPSTGTPVSTDPTELGATADRVLASARSAGLPDPVQIIPAAESGQAWQVAQVKRSWPVRADAVAVDPGSGTVLDVVRFADWPLMAKLADYGVDLHMGILFGVPNQLLLVALALAVICVVVWGYRMWWLRRPTRTTADRSSSALTAPGGTRRPGVRSLLVVGAAAVAVGVAFPVLGVSLVAFLVLDAVLHGHRPAPDGEDGPAATEGTAESPEPAGRT